MDGPRDCHTESRKSDRKRNIIWYQLKWYKSTYLQNSNRLSDLKNLCFLSKGFRTLISGGQWFDIINLKLQISCLPVIVLNLGLLSSREMVVCSVTILFSSLVKWKITISLERVWKKDSSCTVGANVNWCSDNGE